MDLYFSRPGVMSCAGNNIEELWRSVTTKNQKNIKKVTACNGEEFFAARISDDVLRPSSARYDMKIMRIEEAALNQISDDVKAAKARFGAERVAVCVGSCDNGTEFSVAAHRKFFADGGFPQDYSIEVQGADYVATFVAEKFGLKGVCAAFSTACSSSAGAIIKAAELIRAGLADAAVVGGVDIASDTTLIGFNALEAVSSEITNPFSKNRHGITLGDGAAFFVLSREPIASGKNIRLLGWGESADAYHATSPDPSGEGAEKAIRRALENVQIKIEDVSYINMHGTGTKLNDSMESKAIATVFGEANVAEGAVGTPGTSRRGENAPATEQPPCTAPRPHHAVYVSSTKPITGHTLGAAAALEMAICWASLAESAENRDNKCRLPLQAWDKEFDEELPRLNIISEQSDLEGLKSDDIKICLSNSFAFGGANACLAIGCIS